MYYRKMTQRSLKKWKTPGRFQARTEREALPKVNGRARVTSDKFGPYESARAESLKRGSRSENTAGGNGSTGKKEKSKQDAVGDDKLLNAVCQEDNMGISKVKEEKVKEAQIEDCIEIKESRKEEIKANEEVQVTNKGNNEALNIKEISECKEENKEMSNSIMKKENENSDSKERNPSHKENNEDVHEALCDNFLNDSNS
eukprot:TRINITY_DN1869_c0_g2_i4.p1 TRINITY_DN1869_c0_g2~~TRINITY_DN1869_c0_g2_i4.p1  ORF type:complete len:200 (+),score=50.58 TRINITY_DN1869_c0_g2_i4:648-1247(+)